MKMKRKRKKKKKRHTLKHMTAAMRMEIPEKRTSMFKQGWYGNFCHTVGTYLKIKRTQGNESIDQ